MTINNKITKMRNGKITNLNIELRQNNSGERVRGEKQGAQGNRAEQENKRTAGQHRGKDHSADSGKSTRPLPVFRETGIVIGKIADKGVRTGRNFKEKTDGH